MQIDVCNDQIIILDSRCITLLTLPLLHPRIPGSDAPVEVHRPLVELLGPTSTSMSIAQLCNWGPCVPSKKYPFHVDLFLCSPEVSISHYAYKYISTVPVDGMPSCLPVSIGETLLPGTRSNDILTAMSSWITNEDVVYFWNQASDLMVGASHVPTVSIIPVGMLSGLLWRHPNEVQYEGPYNLFSEVS